MVQHAFDLAFRKRIALCNVGDSVKEIVPPDKNIAGIGLLLPEKAAYELAELLASGSGAVCKTSSSSDNGIVTLPFRFFAVL